MDSDKTLKKLGFKVLEIIGEGSFGTVMLAKSKKYHKKVAIKILDPSKANDPEYAAKCLTKELLIFEKVKHPNIIQINEIHKMLTGEVFVIMEAATMDLYEKINDLKGAIPIHQAKTWFYQILDAMIYLHDQNIAHRDLKCENILVTADNQVKITDFGVGCVCESYPDLNSTWCGTIDHMAPEVLQGMSYDAKKSDVWSLGIVLYNMITANVPFTSLDTEKVIQAQAEPIRFPKNMPVQQNCRAIILYMLQIDPDIRPTMAEVAQHPWVWPRHEAYVKPHDGSCGSAGHGPESENISVQEEKSETAAPHHPPAARVTGNLMVTIIEKNESNQHIQENDNIKIEEEEEHNHHGYYRIVGAVKRIVRALCSLKNKILKVFKRRSV